MAEPFDVCLQFTLQQEGGFSDDPRDPGGATCCGITLATLRAWSDDPSLGVDAIRAIQPSTVQAIYSADYWNRMRCDAMPPGVDLMAFDHGVNVGPPRAARILQTALGFGAGDIDGCVGPMTIAAAGKADPGALVDRMAELQTAYYRNLPEFSVFGHGWLGRAERRRQAAQQMISTSRSA